MEIIESLAHRSNYWMPEDGVIKNVHGICWHTTESLGMSALHWFANPQANASCDYFVKRDGAIIRNVPEEATSWACGVRYADRNIIPDWYDDKLHKNYNVVFINIEVEGFHNKPATLKQLDSLIDLAEYLHEMYEIPYENKYYFRHSELSKLKKDPGYCYDVDAVLDEVIIRKEPTLETRVERLENIIDNMKKAFDNGG